MPRGPGSVCVDRPSILSRRYRLQSWSRRALRLKVGLPVNEADQAEREEVRFIDSINKFVKENSTVRIF